MIPTDVAAARLHALFADVIVHTAALLEPLLSLERAWTLDMDTRTGHVARALRARDAYRVWACARDRRAYQGGAHRLLGGELTWLAQHPHIAVDRPEGFDVLICGWGLERALPADLTQVAAALSGARQLLAKGGCWVFDLPTNRPGEVPGVIEHAGGLRVMTQRRGDVFDEVRAAPGVAPEVVSGLCVPLAQWRGLLGDAGWVVDDEVMVGDGRQRMVVV